VTTNPTTSRHSFVRANTLVSNNNTKNGKNTQLSRYVALGPGRTVVPTELGIVLVHGYLKIDPDLVLPKVRALCASRRSSVSVGIGTSPFYE
jgi:hypothetical protein